MRLAGTMNIAVEGSEGPVKLGFLELVRCEELLGNTFMHKQSSVNTTHCIVCALAGYQNTA